MASATSKIIAPIPKDLLVEDGTFFAQAAADQLIAGRDALHLSELDVVPIEKFVAVAAVSRLKVEQKILIVQQAITLFEKLYPHLPFKKQLYNFAHPVESLKDLLQALLAQDMPDAEFHSEMIVCCSFVVDAHTIYGLPTPWRGAIAFLPFQLRTYRDPDMFPRFIVTRVMNAQGDGLPHPLFARGAEVVYWNGSSTDSYVENSRGRLPGGNYRARLSRGVFTATLRPLAFCQLPDETVATLHYFPPGSTEMHAISLPWQVATGFEDRTGFPASSFSVSVTQAASSHSNQIMMHRDEVVEQHQASAALALGLFSVQPGAAAVPSVDLQRISALPSVFQFQYTGGAIQTGGLDPAVLRDPARPDARFGYIRIANFGGSSTGTDEIVNEFQRILRDVMSPKAPDGLVLDIRGNPGGDVVAAESMLQMLTSRQIVPANFHLANSKAVIGALRQLRQLRDAANGEPTPEVEVLLENAKDLQPWIDDVEVSEASQSVLTTGHTLTTPAQANVIGQVYQGPCSLVVDAMAYSAADIFAAGFQDHEIGPLYGVDPNTGGGGANVWQHDDLRTKLPSCADLSLQKLPPEVTLSLAIRRCSRVGARAGQPVEDTGVYADVQYDPLSPEDLLNGFSRIITSACRLMGYSPSPSIELLARFVWRNGAIHVEFRPINMDFVQFFVDGFRSSAAPVQPGQLAVFDLPHGNAPRPGGLRIDGYVALPDGKGGTELILASSIGPLGIADDTQQP